MKQISINWDKVFKKLAEPPKNALFVGYFSDSAKYQDGTKLNEVALWNEYGTISKKGNIHIPPRPFLRNTANNADNVKKWANVISLELSKHSDLDKAFEVVSNLAVDAVKESILNTTTPPNADITIKRKGSSHPLIGKERLLIGGIEHKIRADK